MPDIIVCKYGGSSINSPESVEGIRRITEDDPRRRIIVVSAPGERHENDTRVTDMLIELAGTRDRGLSDRIIDRYREIYPGKAFEDLSESLTRRMGQQLEEGAYLDSLKAFGEEANARLLAQALDAEYVDPKEAFLVSDDFGNARILPESEGMIKKLSRKNILVIPGFYGYTEEGNPATFSRGGSDLSAAYIAASLGAVLYENFTDKDGVRAADPEIVPDARKIPELTFEELRDLSLSGFSIFHAEAMEPVARKRVPVHIRETAGYPSEGTYVVYDRISDPAKPIVGVAYQDGICSFSVSRFGLNDIKGVLSDITAIFKQEGLSIDHTVTGIDDISVILRQDQLRDSHAIGALTNRIYGLVGNGSVKLQDNLGYLVVAGKGLKQDRAISAHAELTLVEAGIDIVFKSQGAEKRCIVFGVYGSDGKKAVNTVYDGHLRESCNHRNL